MSIWSRLFGDEGRIKTTGSINGIFGYNKPTIDSQIYTERMKTVMTTMMLGLTSISLWILGVLILIIYYLSNKGTSLHGIIPIWLKVIICLTLIISALGPILWLLWYARKNNWTGGLKN